MTNANATFRLASYNIIDIYMNLELLVHNTPITFVLPEPIELGYVSLKVVHFGLATHA
jgi:hypothetical protein